LISRVDIKRFYEERIQVKGKSGEEIIGLCPFHEDKTSSFAANLTTGLWKCFPYETGIRLANGKLEQIGKIVNHKIREKVLSYDFTKGAFVASNIIGWSKLGKTEN